MNVLDELKYYDDAPDAVKCGIDWGLCKDIRVSGVIGAPKIDKVFVNKPVTVVLWTDGTRTKSTCDENDQFDPFVGVSVCFAKKMVGKDKLQRIIRKAMK